jgi:hypothetical protein
MKSFLQYLQEDAESLMRWHKEFEQKLRNAMAVQNARNLHGVEVAYPGFHENSKGVATLLNPIRFKVNDALNAAGTYQKTEYSPESNKAIDVIHLNPKHTDVSGKTISSTVHHEAEHARTLGSMDWDTFVKVAKKEQQFPWLFQPREMAARRGQAYADTKAEVKTRLDNVSQRLQKDIMAQPTPPGWLISDDPLQNPRTLTVTDHPSLSNTAVKNYVKLSAPFLGDREKDKLQKSGAGYLSPEDVRELTSDQQKMLAKQIRRQPGKVAAMAQETVADMMPEVEKAIQNNRWIAQARVPKMGVKTSVQRSYVPDVSVLSPSDQLGIANMVANTFGSADTPTNRNTRAKTIAGNPNPTDEREQADAKAAVAGQVSDSGMEYIPGVNSPGTVDRTQAQRTKEREEYQEKTGKDLPSQQRQMYAPWIGH